MIENPWLIMALSFALPLGPLALVGLVALARRGARS